MIGGNPDSVWWERAKVPFDGPFLSSLVLASDDPRQKRIQQLRTNLLSLDAPELSIERARLFTRGWRENPGEPAAVRKALACHYVMEHITIPVVEGQLLWGSPVSRVGAIEVDPEFYARWLVTPVCEGGDTNLRHLASRSHVPVTVPDDVLRELEEDILPYWHDRCLAAHVWRDLELYHPGEAEFMCMGKAFLPNFGKGYSHSVAQYRAVIEEGFVQLTDRVMATGKNSYVGATTQSAMDRGLYCQAMRITADAILTYAKRSAKTCRLEAKRHEGGRRVELERMAQVCERVPAYPARDWHEALQAIQFAHLGITLMDGGVSHSFGRMDQYLLPWYQTEIEKDVEGAANAQELLEHFFLKRYEYQSLRDERSARGLAGDRTNDKITLGGQDSQGNDATTSLTSRFLEAHAHVHLKEPNLSLRIHAKTPRKSLLQALEVIRLGSGLPQLLNDEAIVPALVKQCGVAHVHALNYADIGCQENNTDPNMVDGVDANGHNNGGFFNLPRVLELALFNGMCPATGKQVGPKTDRGKSAETLFKAFEGQLERALQAYGAMNNAVEYHYATTIPSPYSSLLHPGPRSSGVDYFAGGCRYNWIASVGVGIATAADSLAACEALVDHGDISMDDLVVALQAGWKGHEALRENVLAIPRYGAGGSRSEEWAARLADIFCRSMGELEVVRGDQVIPFASGLFSMGINLILGEDVGATPDGRLPGSLISGSTAPSALAENKGPTATHVASAALGGEFFPNGMILNEIWPESLVARDEDMDRWAALVMGFVKLGGSSVQYSIVGGETLKAAKQNPAAYKDLIVRLGGYSARFIDLAEELQDAFIARVCIR